MESVSAAYTAAVNYDRGGNWQGWGYLHGESIGMAVRGPNKVHIWLARDTSKETTIHIRKGIGPVRFEDKVHEWVKKHAASRGSQRGGGSYEGQLGMRPLEDDL